MVEARVCKTRLSGFKYHLGLQKIYMTKILAALIGAIICYEVVAIIDKKEGDTISEVIWKLSAKRPIVPFAFGILMGHFFAQELK